MDDHVSDRCEVADAGTEGLLPTRADLRSLTIALHSARPALAQQVTQLLRHLGIDDIATCPDSAGMISGRPDVLIFDLGSQEDCSELQAYARSGARIVALSEDVSPERITQVGSAGASEVVAIPIMNPNDFLCAILEVAAQVVSCESRGIGDPIAVDTSKLRGLLELAGQERAHDLFRTLQADLARAGADIRIAVGRSDIQALRAASHISIALVAEIGDPGLLALVEEFHAAARLGDTDSISSLAPMVEAGLILLMSQIAESGRDAAAVGGG